MGERLVDVYRAFSEGEAYIIKGKLEESGIRCVLRSNAAPSVYVLTADGMGEVRVSVLESNAEEARRIIAEVPQSNDGGDAPEG